MKEMLGQAVRLVVKLTMHRLWQILVADGCVAPVPYLFKTFTIELNVAEQLDKI